MKNKYLIGLAALVISAGCASTSIETRKVANQNEAQTGEALPADIIQKVAVLRQEVVSVTPCVRGADHKITNTMDVPSFYATVKVCNLKRSWLVDTRGFLESDKFIPGTVKEFYQLESILINPASSSATTDEAATRLCNMEADQFRQRVSKQNHCAK